MRTGLDRLLDAQKSAARAKRLRWKLVPSGGRNAAYKNFVHAVERADEGTLCILLVDSEEPIPPESSIASGETPGQTEQRERGDAKARLHHLASRDKWDLNQIPPETVHLIVQCMETWIVADPDRMAEVYGKGFHPERLPVRNNLEDEPKLEIYSKLARATEDTTKGEYSEANNSKIKHASRLLEKIRADRVAARCPRFSTFTRWLNRRIDEA